MESSHLQCWHPIYLPVQVLPAPPLIQLPAGHMSASNSIAVFPPSFLSKSLKYSDDSALYIVSKIWHQPKGPSRDKYIYTLMHTPEYYSLCSFTIVYRWRGWHQRTLCVRWMVVGAERQWLMSSFLGDLRAVQDRMWNGTRQSLGSLSGRGMQGCREDG